MHILQEAQKCIANQSKWRGLNAFITLAKEQDVLQAIESATPQRKKDPIPTSLTGKLIAIKDNIATTAFPTTAGSRVLSTYTSPYNATVVSLLEDAKAVIIGKTNLDEFGMGSHNNHSFFDTTFQPNPAGERYSVGGSSGGSALAVKTGQAWAALGTDTGGSVRLPAAYTGTVGFKPSYGILSRWGVIAYANSLDTVGILGRDIDSIRSVFRHAAAHDHKDSTSLPNSTRKKIHEGLGERIEEKRLRIGVPSEYNIVELSPTVRQAWLRALSALQEHDNAVIRTISLPTTKHALSAYYVLAPAEASSNLAKYDGVRYGTRAEGSDAAGGILFSKTRGEGFGEEVKRRILLGAYSLSADAIDNYFIQAQKVRRLVQDDFNGVLSMTHPLLDQRSIDGASVKEEDDKVDVILCPTAPTLPPSLKSLKNRLPVDIYMNDVFTVPASLAGLPAISVPVAVERVPEGEIENVGMQIIGQFGDDQRVLEVAERVMELRS